MAQNSKIQWTTHTANLQWGCVAVHTGCDNCYAETLSKRWGNDVWGNDKPRKEIKSVWKDLDRFQRLAKEAGEYHRVFVGSMMDIFEKPMPLIDSKGNQSYYENTGLLRDKLFFKISNNEFPNLIFLLLTKRPSNINKYIPESWKTNPPDNVMFGTSPVNQETADKLIPQLLEVNGKRFLSVEPMLSPIDLSKYLWMPQRQKKTIAEAFETEGVYHCKECGTGGKYLDTPCDNQCYFKPINWVIVGGESGHHKRPFNADWARSIREQCKKTQTPFFMKQMDGILPIPDDLLIREMP